MSKRVFKICPEFESIMPTEYKQLVDEGPYEKNYGVADLGSFKELVEEHPLCAGCGLALSLRLVLASLPAPEDTIIVGSTGCSSLPFTQVAVQNVHSLFGNQNAVATGLKRAMALRFPDKNKDVVVIAGDGATVDIGLDMVMQSWFRKEKITTIMLDNEAYANTGGQESGMSVEGRVLYMAPRGKEFPKVNMAQIARESGCEYTATVSPAYPRKLEQAVRKAILVAREIGPTYVQIFSPCPTNFKLKPSETISVLKSRIKDGTYQMTEYVSDSAQDLLKRSEEATDNA